MTLLTTQFEMHDGKRLRVARLDPESDRRASTSAPDIPFVCMHGYPDNLQIFARLLPLLAHHRPSLAFDWPGLGESDAWKGGASPHQNADRIVRLLDAWGIEKANLIGFDMGGQPALVAASKHPDRVARAVIMSSLMADDVATSWEIRVLRKHGLNLAILRNFPRAVFFRAEATFLGRRERLDADVRQDMWQSFARRDVREFLVRMCAGYEASLPALGAIYGHIKVPVLALWPERDPHFPVAHARWLAKTVTGALVEIVPGARHWMPFTRAEEIAARIVAFTGAQE